MAEHRNYAKSNNVAESSGEYFNLASIISRALNKSMWYLSKKKNFFVFELL